METAVEVAVEKQENQENQEIQENQENQEKQEKQEKQDPLRSSTQQHPFFSSSLMLPSAALSFIVVLLVQAKDKQ
jgi:hypothetical protein